MVRLQPDFWLLYLILHLGRAATQSLQIGAFPIRWSRERQGNKEQPVDSSTARGRKDKRTSLSERSCSLMGSDYPPKCFLPEAQTDERVHTEVAPPFQDSSGRGLEGRPFPEPELFAFLEAQAWESRREPQTSSRSVFPDVWVWRENFYPGRQSGMKVERELWNGHPGFKSS